MDFSGGLLVVGGGPGVVVMAGGLFWRGQVACNAGMDGDRTSG